MSNGRDRDEPMATPADDEVAALFRLAGAAPALPEAEVLPIRDAARETWKRQLHLRASRRRPVWVAASLAAGLLLVLAAAWMLGGGGTPPPVGPIAELEVRAGEVTIRSAGESTAGAPALVAGAVLATGRDGRVGLRLPTGASVRVDGESRVRLDSARSVALERGALYVDSQGLPGGHVEILTPLGRVTDLGTQFEVRLGNATGSAATDLRVRVREGEVRVDTERGIHRAMAGSELVLAADGSVRSAAVAPDHAAWRWAILAAPAPAIEGQTLESFLDWVSREMGLRWRLVAPQPERSPRLIVLHGSVAGLTPEEALEVVLTGSGLRSEIAAGELRVSVSLADGGTR
jgi:ferric-dicitrate binding protein FerR (iron transport regulator)